MFANIIKNKKIKIILILIIIILPFMLQSKYNNRILNTILINIILVISIYIIMSYGGIVSVGHAGFYAIGAYSTALLMINLGLPFFLALLFSALFTAFIGFLLGLPTLRLRAHFLTLATLGFGEIIRLIALNWTEVTRGQDGIGGIPQPLFFDTEIRYYYLLLGVVIFCIYISYRLRNSKYGRAIIALSDNEISTVTMGINRTRMRLMIFTLSAFIAGIAGGMYASLFKYISPTIFSFDRSISILAMLLVGGTGSIWGAIIGAVILTILPEIFRFSSQYYMLFYGIGIVLILIYMPEGVVGFLRKNFKFSSKPETEEEVC